MSSEAASGFNHLARGRYDASERITDFHSFKAKSLAIRPWRSSSAERTAGFQRYQTDPIESAAIRSPSTTTVQLGCSSERFPAVISMKWLPHRGLNNTTLDLLSIAFTCLSTSCTCGSSALPMHRIVFAIVDVRYTPLTSHVKSCEISVTQIKSETVFCVLNFSETDVRPATNANCEYLYENESGVSLPYTTGVRRNLKLP